MFYQINSGSNTKVALYIPSFHIARHQVAQNNLLPKNKTVRIKPPATNTQTTGEVLGTSFGAPSNPVAQVLGDSTTSVKAQVEDILNQYLAEGKFIGPQGPTGPQGSAGVASVSNNGNGQTTSVIGGNPIVTYIPAVTSNNFSGTSLAGFGDLSANGFTTQTAIVGGTLNVSGNTTLSSGLAVIGDSSISGSFSAATSTLSSLIVSGSATIPTISTTTITSLTVSGPVTFTGSTTIAGLTVSGLNPGLTVGSVAFQNSSGLTEDNSNFFYDATNHRFGLGTSTPSQLLTVAGNALVTGSTTLTALTAGQTTLGNASTSALTVNGQTVLVGAAILQSTLNVTGQTSFTTASGTALTLSGALMVNGNSQLATSTITNLTVTNTSTLATLIANGSVTFTGNINLATTTIAQLTVTGNELTSGNATTTGNQIISGTLNVSGTSNLATTTISNLTVTNTTTLASNINLTGTNPVIDLTAGTLNLNTVNNRPLTFGSGLFTLGGNLQVNGNVGIGTTSPTSSLFVQAGANVNPFTVASSSGQSVMVVTNQGNVGIGTTRPSASLDVYGSGATNPFLVSSSSGSTLMVINNQGNVGIGTTTPVATFAVSAATPPIANQFNYANYSTINGGSNGTNVAGFFHATGNSTNYAIYSDAGNAYLSGTLNMNTNSILNAGNMQIVGIATSTGYGNLELLDTQTNHNAGQGGIMTFWGNPASQGNSSNNSLYAAIEGIKENGSGNNSLGDLAFLTQSTSTLAAGLSTAVEAMRITSAGNVGIGTTSPMNSLDMYSRRRPVGPHLFGNYRQCRQYTTYLQLGHYTWTY